MTPDSPTEEELMEAYVAGDPAAFNALFRSVGPAVHGFFVRRFGDPTIADDLLQVTFMKLHRARDSYRIGSALRPWLFTIAARVRLDELRKRHRRPEDSDNDRIERTEDRLHQHHAHDSDTPEEIVDGVRAALLELPESQRVVVVLNRYYGFTFREIAGMLDTTEGAVKLRAFRAYEQLRKKLQPLLTQDVDRWESGLKHAT